MATLTVRTKVAISVGLAAALLSGIYVALQVGEERPVTIWNACHPSHGCTMAHSPTFSPDGSMVAVTADRLRDSVAIFRVSDGEALRTLDAPASIQSLAWSPTGEFLAGASWMDPVREGAFTGIFLWDLEGNLIHQATPDDGSSWPRVSWSPDGDLLAVATLGERNQVHIFRVEAEGPTLSRVQTLDLPYVLYGQGPLAWSPTGEHAALLAQDLEERRARLFVWEVSSFDLVFGELLGARRSGPLEPGYQSISWSPTGDEFALLVSGQGAKRVEVRSLSTGLVYSVEVPSDSAALSWIPVGSLAVGTASGWVLLLENGTVAHRLRAVDEGLYSQILYILPAPHGTYLVVATQYRGLLMVDLGLN